MECCVYPFKTAEIFSDGNVYGCSGGRALSYSFGNIFEKPFDEIWNGERAQEFRRQFIEKDYKYCNFEKCTQKKCAEFSASEKNLPHPARVLIHLNDDNKEFQELIMPALKNAKLVNISVKDEFFEDEKAEKLIQKIIKNYPDIKYAVCTKGAYDIEKGLKKYGLIDKTAHIIINPSAADYKLIKNVKYAAGLKQEGKINDCALQLEKDILNSEIKEEIETSAVKIIIQAQKRKACLHPFKNFEIHYTKDVYSCCPYFINYNKLGDIFENSFEQIWHGDEAEKIRNKMRQGDYSMCNRASCLQIEEADISMLPEKCPAPKHIYLAYDLECNLSCITCRDEKLKNNDEQSALYDKIYDRLKPALKHAEEISLSGCGEAFFSRHTKELIKKITAEYSSIKFNIYTNGLLFTMDRCRALGIYGKINRAVISLPALDKKIYETIMRGADYDTAAKNIKAAAYEYNQGRGLKSIDIRSVISSLNYKEIPKLAAFAQENNIHITFADFVWWGHTEFGRDYKLVSVWDKDHPEFENFKKVLKDKSLNYKKIFLPERFRQIREMEPV